MDQIEDKEFDIIEFLNPKIGSTNWIKEQAENIGNLIDEKKFRMVADKMQYIRDIVEEIDESNYDSRSRIDEVYNKMLEKLCSMFNVNFYLLRFFLIY